MTHIMLDLETWGKRPGCDLRSIGACVFDPATGVVGDRNPPLPSDMEPMSFYVACDNPMLTRDKWDVPEPKYPLHRDHQTVQWWSEQSAEAQGAFADAVDLREALERFDSWLGSLFDYEVILAKTDCLRIWAHGPQFDISILAAAYEAVGLPIPWHYRAPRDTRTIMEAAGIDPHRGLDMFTAGTHHHALDDAICQAKAVCAAYKVLRSKPAVTITDEMINAYSSTYAGGASPATIAQIDRFAAWMNGANVLHLCNVPPEGWYCTRKAGHDGPCAAHPVKQSSPELSSLAGRVLNLGATGTPEYNDLLLIAKRLAGSVLSQDEA